MPDSTQQPQPQPQQQASRPPHDRHRNATALGPATRPVSYLRSGLVAASYPLRGIVYFVRHPYFWPLFWGRLLPLSLISFLVYFLLFVFAFLPQYAFLAIFHGWGAWLNAVVLVLGEGLVIIQGLFEGFFVDECRVDVFDATLINYSLTDLIAPHRVLFPDAPNSVKMLGKPTTAAAYSPWSLVQIAELIFFLPLNLVPYVGTPAFIIITGTRLGKLAHYRWFRLRGMDRAARNAEIRSRSWEYAWFGTVAMILELVPVLSLFFLLTTTAGAAMWVARMEKEVRADVEGQRPGFVTAVVEDGTAREGEDEGAAPPPYEQYEDDPV